eukprot:6432553-Amphidinium_carterae.1
MSAFKISVSFLRKEAAPQKPKEIETLRNIPRMIFTYASVPEGSVPTIGVKSLQGMHFWAPGHPWYR